MSFRKRSVRRRSGDASALFGKLWLPSESVRGTFRGYVLAALITTASVTIKFVTVALAGSETPFVFFPLAVLLSTWFGGLGPGLFSAAYSAGATIFFFVGPERTFDVGSEAFFEVLLYVLESLLFCGLVYAVYHDRLRLSRAKSNLERELSERRRTSAALRESEARFRTMADQAPVMIWIAGLDKEVTYVNRLWLTFTGRTLQEEMGVGWASLIHPDDRAHVLHVYQTAFDAREDFEVEYRLRRADDEYRWVLGRGAPRYLAGGAFAGYIGSTIDVTERRAAEEEVRKRARQNAAVASIGQSALAGKSLDALMTEATRIAAEALDIEYSGVLQLEPDGSLLLRAGSGWKEGVVGAATAAPNTGSHAGYTLVSGAPVAVEDYLAESRFTGSPFLFEHGVVSGIGVAIPGDEAPFGVLGAYATRRRAFTPEDSAFLQAVAHVIATAVQRMRGERRVIASEVRYRALFHGANDAIFVYHIYHDGSPARLIEVNDVACRKLGYSREELLGENPASFIDSSVLNLSEFLVRLRESGTLLAESQHITRAGERIPMEVSAHLIELDGQPTVLSVCRDITERKRADAERAEFLRKERLAREAAEAAERRATFLARASEVLASSLDYEATIRAVADLIVPNLADWCTVTLVGQDGNLHELAASRWDASTRSRTRGQTFIYKPDQEASHGVANVIRTGRTEYYREVTDELLQRAPLKEEQIAVLRQMGLRSVIIVPLTAHGTTLGAMSMVWTNTDRHYAGADVRFAEDLARRAALAVDNARLYREAQEAERRAEEMARLKSAFLANMSHEIRTPLQGVLGFASLLTRRVSGKQHEYAERIMSSGRRLMDTLNAVLTLAKLEARQTDLILEPLDVDREIREVLPAFQRRADERGLYLTYSVEPDAAGITARLDAGGLNSVLHNVIGNALKFTEHGGVTIRLGRAERVSEDAPYTVWIRIEDTGIGIGRDFLAHLFDAFQQESTGFGRSHEGSGLGLSITKRLVEMMDGTIEVESEKGKGSAFTISFPASGDARTAGPPLEKPAIQLDETQKARVLVVEDNPESRDFVTLLLEDACDVTAAATGEEAIEIADAMDPDDPRPFDLVLLDVNLGPGLNGVEVVHTLRKLPHFEHTPIVALTAYALPGDRERFLAAGFTDYIGKPFTAEDLLERTSQLLAK